MKIPITTRNEIADLISSNINRALESIGMDTICDVIINSSFKRSSSKIILFETDTSPNTYFGSDYNCDRWWAGISDDGSFKVLITIDNKFSIDMSDYVNTIYIPHVRGISKSGVVLYAKKYGKKDSDIVESGVVMSPNKKSRRFASIKRNELIELCDYVRENISYARGGVEVRFSNDSDTDLDLETIVVATKKGKVLFSIWFISRGWVCREGSHTNIYDVFDDVTTSPTLALKNVLYNENNKNKTV